VSASSTSVGVVNGAVAMGRFGFLAAAAAEPTDPPPRDEETP